MFGYVVPNRSELRYREGDVYKSYYCGLCRALRKSGGYISALTLTYDMTFLSLLLNSLYEPKCENFCTRCICHPLKKHDEVCDSFSSYAADMSVILGYYKCLDDFHDDRSIHKLFLAQLLKGNVKKIKEKYPKKVASIKNCLSEIEQSEKSEANNLEINSSAFGRLLGEVFTPEDDMWKNTMYEIGFYLGKFIYILDAYDDIEEDLKKNRPNPLLSIYNTPNFSEECETLLNMMAAQCAAAFEKLPLLENVEILRNILYGGLWASFGKAKGRKETKK